MSRKKEPIERTLGYRFQRAHWTQLPTLQVLNRHGKAALLVPLPVTASNREALLVLLMQLIEEDLGDILDDLAAEEGSS